MNSIDTNTVGGRIRSCRMSLGLNLEGMARQIGVSPNYVSVIERNVKRASDKVLRRVADLAEVDFDWLRNGDEGAADTMPNEPLSQPAAGMERIDVSLFLNLILYCSTAISKETVATILNVDAKSLEDILKGTVQFDPAWENGLSNIAQRLELPAMIEKLRGIASFLENVQTRKINFELIRLARDYMSEKNNDIFMYCNSSPRDNETYTDLWRPNMHDDKPVRTFFLEQGMTKDKWRVHVYTKMQGVLAEEALFRAIDGRPRYNDFNAVLMFTDKETFDQLVSKREGIYRRRGLDVREKVKSIVVRLVLFDLDSMTIEKDVVDTV